LINDEKYKIIQRLLITAYDYNYILLQLIWLFFRWCNWLLTAIII